MRELRVYLDDIGPFCLWSLDGLEVRPDYRWDLVDGPVYAAVTGSGSLKPLSIRPDELRDTLHGVAEPFDTVDVVDGDGVTWEMLAFGPGREAALVAGVYPSGRVRYLDFLWSVGLDSHRHDEMVQIVVALGERWPLLFFPGDFQCLASDRALVKAYVAAWRSEHGVR